MSSYDFSTGADKELVIVECYVNGYELRFMIDTGASVSIMDVNALLVFGGQMASQEPSILLEDASGVISAQAARVNTFEALGQRFSGFTMYVYDFLSHSVVTEIDGVLGLDFFAGKKLCIDSRQSTITLS